MSIRLRLALWHAAVLGLVLAGFAELVYLAVAGQMKSQLEYAIHLQALEASRSVHSVSVGPTRVHLLELPSAAATGDNRLYVQLVDPNGAVLASSGSLGPALPPPASLLRLPLDGQEYHDTLNLRGEQLDLYSAPLLVDDRVVGVLQVAASLQPLEASLTRLRIMLGAIVLGAVVLAGGVGWLLAARTLRPVAHITQTANAIALSGDLSRRLTHPGGRDELARLAVTFNGMLGRLEQAATTQRRFLADASHELRTPLTVIRTNVEALRRGATTDPTECGDTLDAIARETDRMGRLVADLLALARADAGQSTGRHPLSLDRLVLEVYEQEKAQANGVQLHIGDFEPVEILGDADRLKQLLLNLVDNGLRYTPTGGSVTLDLGRAEGSAVLRVRDTGPGIAAEHVPRIFERFYRVDEPRSRHAGGTGLGLAICQWVAESHGGRIDVESQEGRGSTFTVLLPIGGR